MSIAANVVVKEGARVAHAVVQENTIIEVSLVFYLVSQSSHSSPHSPTVVSSTLLSVHDAGWHPGPALKDSPSRVMRAHQPNLASVSWPVTYSLRAMYSYAAA